MRDLWDQLKFLITNQPQSAPNTITNHHSLDTLSIPTAASAYLPTSLLKYWNSKSYHQKKLFLLEASLVLSAALYIILPSLPFTRSNNQMFSKRPDKYTTGLINLRNDCFANSSLQAYSSLPSLTEYLNKFIASFRQLLEFIKLHDIDVQKLIDLRLEANKNLQNSKFKRSNSTFEIPLHFAMAAMVKKLQEIEMTTRTISVWTFLHELENIFNAKISRSQHDAHELTQLINETLENENLKLKSFVKFITLNLHKMLKDHPTPKDYTDLERIIVPEFPFDGLILSQMTCLSCHGVSKPNFSPFVILTLPVPLAPSTKLEKLLEENESDQIEDYQCTKCRIGKIVLNEEQLKRNIPADQEPYIKRIFELYNSPTLCINEDIPEDLEHFIKNYNVEGVDISRLTSTVQKKSQILKPPKIFGLHLSRSSFDGQVVTRNSCQVEFYDKMTLSIGSEYHDKLKQFQAMVHEEDEKQMEQLTSKVFTTDVNDMEDEEVQREDIEERGQEDDDDEEDEGDVTDEGTATDNGTDDLEDDEDDDDDEDTSSLTSEESVPQTITTSSTIRPNADASSGSTEHSINLAPISNKQTDNLKEHFKRFKFNDNDLYKYRLRAVIKHVGSHTQGHYECFKHKPLFVKDKEGNIFKLSPEIHDDITGETHADAKLVGKDTKDVKRRSSVRSNGSGELDSKFRGKFSSMMGRRPSVFQANPSDVEEIIQSGLQTPAEILVDDPSVNNFENAFAAHNFKDSFKSNGVGESDKKPEKKVKMKKIPTTISKPYWRISDANVTEVTRGAVLTEETTVYMLYYERVDRKQIKRTQRA
ncbi:Ubiquitin carboxyl-terminal hydrolase 16 [Candida viswanathii]|uniref:Ubiquitin carboxyl-terminal hydrolase 16 n=1 Tax=Candida viswanathii TaxID=5486 RepID=A0A367XQT2_9ASCO|nr:Ubiquitin carboxyl-terminal hydrolase 16 [Candida viswanathii]